ncbi:DUF3800 domain-containing protein [Candidatus Woesearchaeota archaeon]|nr:DUF3800 domain-containing protein [Candidatus Woesearchaeota archaeon]
MLKRTLKKLADVEMDIYFVVFEKNGTTINADVKQIILTHLFRHILKKPKKKIEKVTADLSFFNKQKVNRFILRNYTVEPVKLKNDKGMEFNAESGEITFTRLSDEEFEKIKNDSSSTIVEIEHHNSRLSEELQALDLISGSIFSFSEHGNSEYVTILGKSNAKIEGGKFQKNEQK